MTTTTTRPTTLTTAGADEAVGEDVQRPPPPDDADASPPSAGPEASTTKKAVKSAAPRKRPLPTATSAGGGPAGSKKNAAAARTNVNNNNNNQKRPPSSSAKKQSATAAAAAAATKSSKARSTASPPKPQHILIIDNGGDTVKFGWNTTASSSTLLPHSIPNVTARLAQQITVLVGDQLHSQVQNPNSLLGITRSMERGLITNLGNQVQVWKRALDILHVSIPLHTDTAKAFGWKPFKTSSSKRGSATTTPRNLSVAPLSESSSENAAQQRPTDAIPSHFCAVLLTVPPFCPRTVLDQMSAVWLHDFGVSRVGFVCGPLAAAAAAAGIPAAPPVPGENPWHSWKYGTACVVDVGWSATHVMPLIPTVVENDNDAQASQIRMKAVESAIRRLPLAGRHLINVWKYQASYRQWNLMDHEWLVRQVLEQTGLVSLDFAGDMRLAQRVSAGRRPFDREVVLPDFTTTFQIEVRLPAALQQAQAAAAKGDDNDEDADEVDDEDDSDVDAQEMLEAEDSGDDDKDEEDGPSSSRIKMEVDDDDDDEEDEDETPAQIRRRLLKQREEEARRRREQEAEQQVLHVSVERFAIPEALFRPSDVGLPRDWAGLPAAIAQSIEACPRPFQPALWQSIHLVGGLTQLPGLQERLYQELRALAPCEWEICIETANDPVHGAWMGACNLSHIRPVEEWSISRDEFLDSKQSKRGLWKRFQQENGDFLI